eukprot:4053474-Heterocapsa_arctica.AAC.1
MPYLIKNNYDLNIFYVELVDTRAGVPQYSGTAYDFQEWKFRILTKTSAIEAQKPEDRDLKRIDL